MQVIVKVYDMSKYSKKSKVFKSVEYNIEGFEVRTIPEYEILKETDGSCVDEYDEYLILHFYNGETSTFRNSMVDLFRK